MTAAEIKEYLCMVVELEKEVYTQNRVIASLAYKLSALPGYRQYTKPVYNKVTLSHYDVGTADMVAFMCLPGAALLFFIGALLYEFRDFFWEMGCLAGIVGLIAFFIVKMSQADARLSAEKEAKKNYDAALKAYNLAVEQEKLRVRRELPRKTLLQKQLKEMKDANQKTKATLEKLYEKNIIHKNYRGLIPVCSLYGYFDTGVCTQLEGHEGAYNKYDTESRLDQIIVKIDQVIKHLEEIKEIQWMLYDAVEESNCKVGQLINNCEHLSNQLNGIQAQGAELNARVERLQTTSDLNLYVNACAKRELEYMNRANRIF